MVMRAKITVQKFAVLPQVRSHPVEEKNGTLLRGNGLVIRKSVPFFSSTGCSI